MRMMSEVLGRCGATKIGPLNRLTLRPSSSTLVKAVDLDDSDPLKRFRSKCKFKAAEYR